jgi:hypothetical protein
MKYYWFTILSTTNSSYLKYSKYGSFALHLQKMASSKNISVKHVCTYLVYHIRLHCQKCLPTLWMQMSGQVTGKDVPSFADQMTSVANHITDQSTLSQLDTLASTTHQLLVNHVQPLEQHKVIKLAIIYDIRKHPGVERDRNARKICLHGLALRSTNNLTYSVVALRGFSWFLKK